MADEMGQLGVLSAVLLALLVATPPAAALPTTLNGQHYNFTVIHGAAAHNPFPTTRSQAHHIERYTHEHRPHHASNRDHSDHILLQILPPLTSGFLMVCC